jgi:hypothetical protein
MKGQISIAYLGILTVISLALFGVILMWNLSIKDANTDLLAKIEMESIVEKIESDINYIESLNENGTISVTRKIPEKIGENRYTITLFADGTPDGECYPDNDQILISRSSSERFTFSETRYHKDINTSLCIIPSSASGSEYTLTSNNSGIQIN